MIATKEQMAEELAVAVAEWTPYTCDIASYPEIFRRIPGIAEAEAAILRRGGDALVLRCAPTGTDYPHLRCTPKVVAIEGCFSRVSWMSVECISHRLGFGSMLQGVLRLCAAARRELVDIDIAIRGLHMLGDHAGMVDHAQQQIEEAVLIRQFSRHDDLWRWLRAMHVAEICRLLIAGGLDVGGRLEAGRQEYTECADEAWSRYVARVPVVVQTPDEVRLASPVQVGCEWVQMWARADSNGMWHITDLSGREVFLGDADGAVAYVRGHTAGPLMA